MNEDMKHADLPPAPLDDIKTPPNTVTEAAGDALLAISAWVINDKLMPFREVGPDLRKALYDANDKLSKALAAPPALNAPDSPLGKTCSELTVALRDVIFWGQECLSRGDLDATLKSGLNDVINRGVEILKAVASPVSVSKERAEWSRYDKSVYCKNLLVGTAETIADARYFVDAHNSTIATEAASAPAQGVEPWRVTLLETHIVIGRGEGCTPIWFERQGNINRDRIEETVAAHNSSLASLRGELEEAKKPNQRLLDLVRQCRVELHEQKLITDAEYAEIAEWGSTSARRLEDYDALRSRLKKAEAALAWYQEIAASIQRYCQQGNIDSQIACMKELELDGGIRAVKVWQ